MTENSSGRVECYSGHTYPQEPRAVVWQARRLSVTRIERRWRTPQGPAFSVETEQGACFELHYDELEDLWTIQPDAGTEALEFVERAEDEPEDMGHNHH